jgi:hypothetical protein
MWSYDAHSWTGMHGLIDGKDPDSEVLSINGGRGCGE